MAQGYLLLLLHAHLPYVRHPEYEHFLEELWLFEAITECYLPLLTRFERLSKHPFRLTLSLSPTLLSMWEDPLLQQRYVDHLNQLIKLARKEVSFAKKSTQQRSLARFYLRLYRQTLINYEENYQRDLITPFKRLQQKGVLEIITTAATHGYLPLLRFQSNAVKAQLCTAAQTYTRLFEQPANGIWLPECAYYQGLDEVVKSAGFNYCFLDGHGLQNAQPPSQNGVWAPLVTPNGVAVFGRDPGSSNQVWSAHEGYPGDYWYREFYRDVGFDRPSGYLGDYFYRDGYPIATGLKYHRITSDGETKDWYQPQQARQQTAIHAQHFIQQRRQAIAALAPTMNRPPVVVAPYDAELFGHWWFEGPCWLDQVIQQQSAQPDLQMITASDYLAQHPTLQLAQPAPSSWGAQGHNEHWLNQQNDWIYPQLHQAANTMQQMVQHSKQPTTIEKRALAQAGRSLLLAQASDWPFILKTGTSVAYAEKRIRDHLARFHYLARAIVTQSIEYSQLQTLEYMDPIFPDLDYRDFS